MESVKTWTYSLVVVAIICAFCEMLVGTKALKKGMGVLISLVTALCFIAPLEKALDIAPDNSSPAFKETYISENMLVDTYVLSLEKSFEAYLQRNCDENAKVLKIDTLKDANGNIYITEVTVRSNFDRDSLEELIRKEFGKNAVLVCR